ncbi:hypothetical protein QW131_16210 [Roseibium salinum]|nr:hypothetical protein [Roseibium salinum]
MLLATALVVAAAMANPNDENDSGRRIRPGTEKNRSRIPTPRRTCASAPSPESWTEPVGMAPAGFPLFEGLRRAIGS